MSANEAKDRAEFIALMERTVRLGGLLSEDFDLENAYQVAEAKLLIAEMNRTRADIDALLARYAKPRNSQN
jgi:hypothetical protein